MKLPYYQIDAFTSRLFGGNPAGVCILDHPLPAQTMQAIAFENNLAETAFVEPAPQGYGLRWFTPTTEVDLCGHATLASAHALRVHRGVSDPQITFHTRSGALTASFGERWELDFPSMPAHSAPLDVDLVRGLGREPVQTLKARDYLAILESEADVRAIKPNFEALSRLDCLGIIVTAPGADCDFVSRFFAPRVGIPEDPATGSMHCTLTPYWTEVLAKEDLFARQASARGGEFWCRLAGERVRIGGEAITYSEGTIAVA